MISILVFLIGLIIGSFMNVCIYRIPLRESIVTESSHCPVCKTHIKWYDLVPLFSYLLLKGKCRVCKTKISSRYPLVEFANGAGWFLLYLIFGLKPMFFVLCVILSIFMVIAFIDNDRKKSNLYSK